MSRPAPTHGKLVEHRRENKIVLEIEIRPRSIGTELPWDSIRIPRTKSVQRSAVLGNKKALDFRLEVQGATTGTIRGSLCDRCAEKESRNSKPPTLVDFASKTNIIGLKGGTAQVAFRFLCLSTHHGLADSEYRITAIISSGNRIVAQHALQNPLRVTSRGPKTKNVNAAGTGAVSDSARTLGDRIQGPVEMVLQRDAISASAPPTSTPGATVSGFDLLLNASRVLSNPQQVTSPIAVQPATQHLASNMAVDEGGDCFISLLSPPCGATSGGAQIVLVVKNLPPSIDLFARFGDTSVVATSYHAPGVLVCNLPPAAQPGTVEVTLSRTPSLDAPAYAKSLVNFTYESDTNKAATLLLRSCDSAFLPEAMGFIQRMFQSHKSHLPAISTPQASWSP